MHVFVQNGVKFDVTDEKLHVDSRKRHSSARSKRDKLYKDFIKVMFILLCSFLIN